MLVSSFLYKDVKNFTFRIDSTPQIYLLAVNFQKYFVQMPCSIRPGPALPQSSPEQRAEMVRPTALSRWQDLLANKRGT